ncbi:hypothetical protein KAI58_03625 [Candidatus Gracilibacteria bacterium]|nr:hypothetical protein [Candidatus Gracilibacteria bacterium]
MRKGGNMVDPGSESGKTITWIPAFAGMREWSGNVYEGGKESKDEGKGAGIKEGEVFDFYIKYVIIKRIYIKIYIKIKNVSTI